MNFPGTVVLNSGAQGSISPFEILHALVHSALAPYFDAYSKGQENQSGRRLNRFADTEAKTGMLRGGPWYPCSDILLILRYSCNKKEVS